MHSSFRLLFEKLCRRGASLDLIEVITIREIYPLVRGQLGTREGRMYAISARPAVELLVVGGDNGERLSGLLFGLRRYWNGFAVYRCANEVDSYGSSACVGVHRCRCGRAGGSPCEEDNLKAYRDVACSLGVAHSEVG